MSERLVLWHRRVPALRDELEDPEPHAAWLRHVAQALTRAHGDVVAIVGTAASLEFDPMDAGDALDAALALLDEAERAEPRMQVCFGVALGVVTNGAGPAGDFRQGAAFDRAQLLSNRARPGEIVLDPASRELAAARYLFARTIGTGAGALKGHTIDRAFPRRDACRPAIEHLAAPQIPAGLDVGIARLTQLADGGGQDRLILRGGKARGLSELIDVLAFRHQPPLVLRLEAVPGALEPLGSLRYALTRRWKTRLGVEAAVANLPDEDARTLTAIAKGIAVDRGDAVAAVSTLLDAHTEESGRPWVIADPLNAVDPATIGVVADAMAVGTEALFIGRLPPDARPPKQLVARGEIEELELPPLSHDDARQIAHGVLGETTADDVCRRVAVLGGQSMLGVIEAARTLIAGGDLIRVGEAYRWRVSPRTAVNAIPVESHIEERFGATESAARRILEAVCAAPSGSPSELARSVAMADGIDIDTLAEGIERLCSEAFLAPEEPLYATSAVLRSVVVQTMPAPRMSEMYRFIAGAMEAAAAKDAEFEKATIGYYLAEGGQEEEGARALIEAGRAAALCGFPRAAVRLAAAAVQYDPGARTRNAATMLSRSVSTQRRGSAPPPPETVIAIAATLEELAEGPTETVGSTVTAALAKRDFESVDRLLDIAVAEGHDRAAADRMRALAALGRGELQNALFDLHQSREALSDDDDARARTELVRSIILLGMRRPEVGLRCALRALRMSRATKNANGEAASLQVLSLCYRALGRAEDAAAFTAPASAP